MSFLAHLLHALVVWTLGVFYVIFLQHMEGSKAAIALIVSIHAATYYVSGPVAGVLIQRYGCRAVGQAGGVITVLGLVLSSKATNIYHMYATFSLMAGLGLGLVHVSAVTIVGLYFEARRNVAMGLAVSGVGLGASVAPFVIQQLVKQYGWRGGMLMTAAICSHLLLCAALYREPPVQESADVCKNTPDQLSKLTWLKEIKTMAYNKMYQLLILNNLLFCFGLSVVYIHLSAYSGTLGSSIDQGAMLFAIMGFANASGRVLYGVVTHIFHLNVVNMYIIAMVGSGTIMLFLPSVASYTPLVVCSALFGLLSAGFGTMLPQTVILFLGVERLSSAFGCILVADAVGVLTGSPTAGWLFDHTGDYTLSFYVGGAVVIISGMVMVPACFQQCHSKANDHECTDPTMI